MAIMTLEGNSDDGYSPKEIADGIDQLNELANDGHDLGGLALTGVGTRILGEEATVYGRSRVVLPTGYLAVSRAFPPNIGYPPTSPGSENYIG